jgi:hypothetical protein
MSEVSEVWGWYDSMDPSVARRLLWRTDLVTAVSTAYVALITDGRAAESKSRDGSKSKPRSVHVAR